MSSPSAEDKTALSEIPNDLLFQGICSAIALLDELIKLGFTEDAMKSEVCEFFKMTVLEGSK